MKLIAAVSVQRNCGLLAALILAIFVATMILVGSFAAVDAGDGAEGTYAIDPYDAECPDDNDGWYFNINFKSSDTTKGSVAEEKQLVPMAPRETHEPALIYAFVAGKDGFGIAVTIKMVFALIFPIPTWVNLNFAIPADGYELDYWTMNGEQGRFFKFVPNGSTFEAHFKEKTIWEP